MIAHLAEVRKVRDAAERTRTMTPEELDEYIDQLSEQRRGYQGMLDKIADVRRRSERRCLGEAPENVVPFVKPCASGPDDGGSVIDILELDPTDRSAVDNLVQLLHTHCTADQCEQFLIDLDDWERSIPDEAHVVMGAYTRMVARGAFVPAIVRKHITATDQLAQSPRWEEIQQWRTFIASLPVTARKVA